MRLIRISLEKFIALIRKPEHRDQVSNANVKDFTLYKSESREVLRDVSMTGVSARCQQRPTLRWESHARRNTFSGTICFVILALL